MSRSWASWCHRPNDPCRGTFCSHGWPRKSGAKPKVSCARFRRLLRGELLSARTMNIDMCPNRAQN
eukprot:9477707-Pyramimonas_sp.AAC.1